MCYNDCSCINRSCINLVKNILIIPYILIEIIEIILSLFIIIKCDIYELKVWTLTPFIVNTILFIINVINYFNTNKCCKQNCNTDKLIFVFVGGLTFILMITIGLYSYVFSQDYVTANYFLILFSCWFCNLLTIPSVFLFGVYKYKDDYIQV